MQSGGSLISGARALSFSCANFLLATPPRSGQVEILALRVLTFLRRRRKHATVARDLVDVGLVVGLGSRSILVELGGDQNACSASTCRHFCRQSHQMVCISAARCARQSNAGLSDDIAVADLVVVSARCVSFLAPLSSAHSQPPSCRLFPRVLVPPLPSSTIPQCFPRGSCTLSAFFCCELRCGLRANVE